MQGRQATHLLSLSQGCLGAVQLPPGERQLRPAIPCSSSLPGREGCPFLSILQGRHSAGSRALVPGHNCPLWSTCPGFEKPTPGRC